MPYYVFEMTSPDGMELVKNLKLLTEFDSFKQAKKYAREKRTALDENTNVIVKIMFADNQLLAEEQLLVHRDKPIIMEHEK